MIKSKPKTIYQCSSCSHVQVRWTGQCSSCKNWNTINEVTVQAKKHYIKKISDKKREAINNPSKEDIELKEWFEYQNNLARNNPYCEECGSSVLYLLDATDTKIKRSCHAHIIEKRNFRSVQSNPINHLLLCGVGSLNQCHHQYDSNHDSMMSMSIIGIALQRYNKFKHLITESTSHLPAEFQK